MTKLSGVFVRFSCAANPGSIVWHHNERFGTIKDFDKQLIAVGKTIFQVTI
jgi:hypothetical protein